MAIGNLSFEFKKKKIIFSTIYIKIGIIVLFDKNKFVSLYLHRALAIIIARSKRTHLCHGVQ